MYSRFALVRTAWLVCLITLSQSLFAVEPAEPRTFVANSNGTFNSTDGAITNLPREYVDVLDGIKKIIQRIKNAGPGLKKKIECSRLRKEIKGAEAQYQELMRNFNDLATRVATLKTKLDAQRKVYQAAYEAHEEARTKPTINVAQREIIRLLRVTLDREYKTMTALIDELAVAEKELNAVKRRTGADEVEKEINRLKKIYDDMGCGKAAEEGASFDELNFDELEEYASLNYSDAPFVDNAVIDQMVRPGAEADVMANYNSRFVPVLGELNPPAFWDDHNLSTSEIVDLTTANPAMAIPPVSAAPPPVATPAMPAIPAAPPAQPGFPMPGFPMPGFPMPAGY